MSVNRTYTVTAITLKYYDLGEADKILALFTRENGLIRVVAKGLKRAKSKFSGYFDLLNVNQLEVRKGRNLGTIIQCDSYKVFPLLRSDYDKLILSLFLGELILLFCPEEEPSEPIFDLLLLTLETIQFSDTPLQDVLWFEMQLLKILGYKPDLDFCSICHQPLDLRADKMGFCFSTAGIIGHECLKIGHNYKLINAEQLKAFRHLLNSSIHDIDIMLVLPDILQKNQDILKQYLTLLSERNIKTLSLLDIS